MISAVVGVIFVATAAIYLWSMSDAILQSVDHQIKILESLNPRILNAWCLPTINLVDKFAKLEEKKGAWFIQM